MSVFVPAPPTRATAFCAPDQKGRAARPVRHRPLVEPLERRRLLAAVNVATYDVFGTESNPTEATPLLTFRDTDPDGTFGPFTARISWGDASTSNGTVT